MGFEQIKRRLFFENVKLEDPQNPFSTKKRDASTVIF